MTGSAERTAAEPGRPRVTMLVANGVKGDSRVQKIAWSMAAAGWQVTLVGRAPGAEPERYRLGAAEVLLVPVPKTVSGYEGARLRGGSRAAKLRPAYRAARAELAARDAEAGRRVRSQGAAAARAFLAERPGLDALLARTGRGPLGGGAHKAVGTVLGGVDRYGGWRWFNPWFADLELALGPVVRDLDPDLIHAHDFHMVGIGARLAATLSTPARPVRWVYDAHEYLRGIEVPGKADVRLRMRRRMLVGVESEYIGRADAVVTVSEGIAQRLAEDHRLAHRPAVILNAPVIGAGAGVGGSVASGVRGGAASAPDNRPDHAGGGGDHGASAASASEGGHGIFSALAVSSSTDGTDNRPNHAGGEGGHSAAAAFASEGDHGTSAGAAVLTGHSLRADCGLADDVPLLLYSGGMSPRRGVATAVEALVRLPAAHLALIARTDDPDIPALIHLAERLGVSARLHVVPYVPVDRVVPYISSATLGLIPILHLPNHELSLITKYFEYLHACLPIVTSDVREMAAETRRLGVGEVFVAGDDADLAAAVLRVLSDPGRYRAVYAGPADPRPASSWAGQAARLDVLYRSLLGVEPGPAREAGPLELLPVGDWAELRSPA